MIRKELVSAVVDAVDHVFGAVGAGPVEVQRTQAATQIAPFKETCVGIGFEGGAEGGVYLMMDALVGGKIAAKMDGSDSTPGETVVHANLMELLNMIAGNSVGLLARAGVRVSITTPVIVTEPLTPPYGAECALVFMQSPLGPLKTGLVIAEAEGR